MAPRFFGSLLARMKRYVAWEDSDKTRYVSWRRLIKGTAILMVAPTMLLFIFLNYNIITLQVFLLGEVFLFLISIIFVRPYLANLSALTHYVNQLVADRKADAPDLTFLNNVEALSEAVEALHRSWQHRRDQLEGMLHESRVLVDSLPDVILLLNQQGGLVRTNRRAEEVFGGRLFKETVQGVLDKPQLAEAIDGVLEGGKGQTLTLYVDHPHEHYYLTRVEPFPGHVSADIALVVVLHDVTDLKRSEQMLSDFVANASHEIRTPLTSIAGLIETLQTSARHDEKAQQEFLETMQHQTERMSRLVQGLLSLSHIERQQHKAPEGVVFMRQLVQEAYNGMLPKAKDAGVALKLDVDSNVGDEVFVCGDHTELEQVLDNILGNAIKYSRADSEVVMQLFVVEDPAQAPLSLDQKTDWLCVAVKDQGCGIAPEHLPRLTERFYRADNTRGVSGSGIGLAIVKHILERHRGHLHVQSVVGQGSCFRVYLPKGVKPE